MHSRLLTERCGSASLKLGKSITKNSENRCRISFSPDRGTVPSPAKGHDSGLEVDAIIELADGRWAAFEVKTSEAKASEGVENLRRLRSKVLRNPRARTRPPEFMAVLTGVSELAHQVEDGIYVIPIRCLGA